MLTVQCVVVTEIVGCTLTSAESSVTVYSGDLDFLLGSVVLL